MPETNAREAAVVDGVQVFALKPVPQAVDLVNSSESFETVRVDAQQPPKLAPAEILVFVPAVGPRKLDFNLASWHCAMLDVQRLDTLPCHPGPSRPPLADGGERSAFRFYSTSSGGAGL
jgi:hypothetical protein